MAAETPLSVLVVGASGDLAKKKTYPSLFCLYCLGLLPSKIKIYGYARSAKEDGPFRETIGGYLKPIKGAAVDFETSKASFLALCVYRQGGYDSIEAMGKVATEMRTDEGDDGGNRLFYFAIPPTVFASVSRTIRDTPNCQTEPERGWSRVVIEKPFGHDSASSAELSAQIAECFHEKQIYRIDHYLGKEMVQNLLGLRFANRVFEPLWRAEHVKCVQITFKEPFGTEGRGGYFDSFGIVRDVMQNHLLQVLSLVAMEPPVSLDAEDVRDEKVKVLRSIPPIVMEEVVLGQYGPHPEGKEPAYTADPGVPDDSVTPTFAAAVLHINNARWNGVPFVLKCGKALNERKAEIRIQFKARPSPALYGGGSGVHENELVMRIQPDEAVYLKMMAKVPGLDDGVTETELDLSYKTRYADAVLPDAYARLILDVVRGDHSHFVRGDELEAAWAIFTPMLHHIERERIKPTLYTFGSRGPPAADELIASAGYSYNARYSDAFGRPVAAPAGGAGGAGADVVMEGFVSKRSIHTTMGVHNWRRRKLQVLANPTRFQYTKDGDSGAIKEFPTDESSTVLPYDSAKKGAVRVTGPAGELCFVPIGTEAAEWIEAISKLLGAAASKK